MFQWLSKRGEFEWFGIWFWSVQEWTLIFFNEYIPVVVIYVLLISLPLQDLTNSLVNWQILGPIMLLNQENGPEMD